MEKKLYPGSAEVRENIPTGSAGFWFRSSYTHTSAVTKINLSLLLHSVNTAGDFKPSVPACGNVNTNGEKLQCF